MLQHLPTNKSVVQKVGVQCYISDSSVQATLPASLCRRMQTAVWQANQMHCCHIALRTVVAVQQSDSEYSNDTFTVTTGDDINRRPTGDPQHSTQFPILTAVPQYGCTGTDSLLQRAQFTVWYSALERLHTSPGMHALNKQTLKKQSESGKAEEKLHRSFNKWTGFSQNCNSERGQSAELLPNSGKHVQLSSDSAKREDCSFLLALTKCEEKQLCTFTSQDPVCILNPDSFRPGMTYCQQLWRCV